MTVNEVIDTIRFIMKDEPPYRLKKNYLLKLLSTEYKLLSTELKILNKTEEIAGDGTASYKIAGTSSKLTYRPYEIIRIMVDGDEVAPIRYMEEN